MTSYQRSFERECSHGQYLSTIQENFEAEPPYELATRHLGPAEMEYLNDEIQLDEEYGDFDITFDYFQCAEAPDFLVQFLERHQLYALKMRYAPTTSLNRTMASCVERILKLPTLTSLEVERQEAFASLLVYLPSPSSTNVDCNNISAACRLECLTLCASNVDRHHSVSIQNSISVQCLWNASRAFTQLKELAFENCEGTHFMRAFNNLLDNMATMPELRRLCLRRNGRIGPQSQGGLARFVQRHVKMETININALNWASQETEWISKTDLGLFVDAVAEHPNLEAVVIPLRPHQAVFALPLCSTSPTKFRDLQLDILRRQTVDGHTRLVIGDFGCPRHSFAYVTDHCISTLLDGIPRFMNQATRNLVQQIEMEPYLLSKDASSRFLRNFQDSLQTFKICGAPARNCLSREMMDAIRSCSSLQNLSIPLDLQYNSANAISMMKFCAESTSMATLSLGCVDMDSSNGYVQEIIFQSDPSLTTSRLTRLLGGISNLPNQSNTIFKAFGEHPEFWDLRSLTMLKQMLIHPSCRLTELFLYDSFLDDVEFSCLCQGLEDHECIERLAVGLKDPADLADIWMGGGSRLPEDIRLSLAGPANEAVEALTQLLDQHENLDSLSLETVGFSLDEHEAEDDFLSFAQAIHGHPSLQSLRIGCQIDSIDWSRSDQLVEKSLPFLLGAGVETSGSEGSLKTLDLSACYINLKSFVNCLPQVKSLEKIRCSYHPEIDSEIRTSLSEALKANTSVECIGSLLYWGLKHRTKIPLYLARNALLNRVRGMVLEPIPDELWPRLLEKVGSNQEEEGSPVFELLKSRAEDFVASVAAHKPKSRKRSRADDTNAFFPPWIYQLFGR